MLNYSIRPATMADLGSLTDLFDLYRQGYQQPSNLPLAKVFISVRLKRGDSALFVAEGSVDGSPVLLGFVQLIPSFSSIAARPIWILSDTFVRPEWRGEGVGQGLLAHAVDFARQSGVKRIVVEASQAQPAHLEHYRKLGFTSSDNRIQLQLDF
ncbi:GNAT family N-acetyltransferase [Parvibium lacunae]|uniref:GNAT family N-acetyltransferase n=1 Tax=Parvibium lacunae TaxID=1888893 RepID=A0A368L697_9BURK|nr:GNAT family N-acetyltransferase [Parvibium lacunae]RCS59200.1 GNAT family N-acetyltransferase [Parvibium lacunae]